MLDNRQQCPLHCQHRLLCFGVPLYLLHLHPHAHLAVLYQESQNYRARPRKRPSKWVQYCNHHWAVLHSGCHLGLCVLCLWGLPCSSLLHFHNPQFIPRYLHQRFYLFICATTAEDEEVSTVLHGTSQWMPVLVSIPREQWKYLVIKLSLFFA